MPDRESLSVVLHTCCEDWKLLMPHPKWLRRILNVLGLTITALMAGPGMAQVSCSFNTQALNFGRINPVLALPVTLSLSNAIVISCTHPGNNSEYLLPITVTLSPGLSGNSAKRKMIGVNNATLDYNIYVDASFNYIWPSVPTPGLTNYNIPIFASSGSLQITLFGKVPLPQPSVVAGQYSDIVAVTLSY